MKLRSGKEYFYECPLFEVKIDFDHASKMWLQNKIKIGILGGSGYAGEELVRLISLHPNADLVAVSSRELQGLSVADTYKDISFLENIKNISCNLSCFS